MFEIVNGDALQVLRQLRAGCIHTCVTSPPYYGLRDYGAEGQVGLEDTPQKYVDRLVEIFGEVRRVLRDDGTLWLNLGDSYAANRSYQVASTKGGPKIGQAQAVKGRGSIVPEGLKPKDLIGIPWMVAFALRADGWYLRSDIIWQKPNVMPSSVTDRPTSSHEYMFLLSKSQRYFYDHVAVQEDAVSGANGSVFTKGKTAVNGGERLGQGPRNYDSPKRNLRDVWSIASQPFKGAHFATFPPALIEPCIKAGTSAKGCCMSCGAPWRRVVERTAMVVRPSERREDAHAAGAGSGRTVLSGTMLEPPTTTTIGWEPGCTCGSDVVPAVVLDPFNGSGTTGIVSLRHGRRYLGIELNSDYVKMANERILSECK